METPGLNLLQRCRDAQRQLDEAIQCYLQRAADLEAATYDPIHYSSDRQLLETAIHEAHRDSQLLPSRADQLMKARVTFNRIRNRSTSLVPINRLPMEVLLQIFRFAARKGSCTLCDALLSDPHLHKLNCPEPPLSLTHVCQHWRTIVVNMPSLWTHVGLSLNARKGIKKECDYARTCLQRAPNSPLCIWIDGSIDPYRGGPDNGMELFMSCLRPHVGNLESFSLIDHPDNSEIRELVSLWMTHGRAGSVRHLTVWLEDGRKDCNLFWTHDTLNLRYLDSFLEPIRVLRLNGAYFDWDSSAYHNLVVLQLGGLGVWSSPTARQMLALLSASPELHTLKLYNMSIRPEADPPAPLPSITLRELKYLDLRCIHDETICGLLPQIVPPASPLSIRIDLYPASAEFASTVQTFLFRTNATKLYIYNSSTANCLADYLSAVPNLSTLILELPLNSRSNDDRLKILMQSSEPDSERVPLCPGLRTLFILNGAFGATMRQKLVESRPALTNLRFIPDSCHPVPPGSIQDTSSRLEEILTGWHL